MIGDLKVVEDVIRDVICERFSKEAVSQVVIRPDRDSDGDQVFRILIVLEVQKGKNGLDAKKMVGLVRHIRARLDDLHAEEFPIVSFVSKSESGKMLESA